MISRKRAVVDLSLNISDSHIGFISVIFGVRNGIYKGCCSYLWFKEWDLSLLLRLHFVFMQEAALMSLRREEKEKEE